MGRLKLKIYYLSFMALVIALAPIAAECAEFELTFAHIVPQVAPPAKVAQEWGKKIEAASKGRVKITYYWGGQLIPPGETLKYLQKGLADIAFMPPDPNFQPLNYGLLLPFIGVPSMEVGSKVYAELLKKYPEVTGEFKGTKIFAPRYAPTSHLHFTKKTVRTPADFKGLKIRTAQDKRIARFVKLAGGIPVEVTPPDLYLSMERGIVDGAYLSFPAVSAWRIMPLMKTHTVFGDIGIVGDLDVLAFSLQKWNKLPDDIKKIIEDLEPWYLEQMIKADKAEVANALAQAQKEKHTIVKLSPDEVKQWSDFVTPIHKEWIADMKDRGYNSQAIYDDIKSLIAKYAKK